MEIEVKFFVDDAAVFERYLHAAELAGFQLGEPRRLAVEDEYLDTAACDVEAAGYTLRERRVAGSRVTTVKCEWSQWDMVSLRQEYEFPSGESVQLRDWPPNEARQLLEPIIRERELETQFCLRQMRTQRHLTDAEARRVAELSMDQVEVWYRGRNVDAFEVLEIELLSDGRQEVLARVIEQLSEEGLSPVTVAKVNRARVALARSRGDI